MKQIYLDMIEKSLSAYCRYSFNGELSTEFACYYNRNGRYRVYSVNSRNLHIEIENGEEAL